MRSRLTTVLLALAAGLAPTRATAQSQSQAPRIAASADVNGQFNLLDCRHPGRQPPLVSVASQLAGAGGAVRFDAGNLVGSSAASRLAIERDADAFASAVAATGLSALALGHGDLAAPRASLLRAARALAAHHLPYVLSNLTCDPAASEVCDVVMSEGEPPLLVDTPWGRVGFVSALDPSALGNVARDRSTGLTLHDVRSAIAAATARAREAGARWVVAAFDPAWGNELRDALALARSLDGDAAPDVLLVARVGNEVAAALPSTGRTLVVGTRAESVVLVEPGTPRPVRAPEWAEPAAPVVAYARSLTEQACREGAETLPGGTTPRVLDRDGFAALVLDVMRDRSRSEIAMINRGAISPRGSYPIVGGITRLSVSAALPFDNFLRTASVPGAVLKKLLKSPQAAAFYFRGIEVQGDSVKVNGRTIDETLEYTLVTIDYVAEGGNGGVGDATVHFAPFGTESLRDALMHWLDVSRGADVTAAPIDPSQRTRWTLHYALDVSVSSVNVSNDNSAVLSDAQLARATSVTARGETQFRADADHPGYTLENYLRLLYGATYVTQPGMPARLDETADLIAARSTAVYRRLFNAHPHWYEPLPFADVYAESEFSVPTTRTYRHLEVRPIVGERLQVNTNFSLYGGVGFSWEVLARSDQLDPVGPTAVPVLVAGWQLRPSSLFLINGRSADAETTMDVTWRDPLGDPGLLVRFHSKLAIPVVASVSITLGLDLFARYAQFVDMNGARAGAWGAAADGFIGIRVAYAQAFQAFSF